MLRCEILLLRSSFLAGRRDLETSSMIKRKSATDNSQAAPWWVPTLTALFLGFLLFILTFTPSLVPRPPIFQGLLGGIAFSSGMRSGMAA
jgi:uncharacterized membrane protein